MWHVEEGNANMLRCIYLRVFMQIHLRNRGRWTYSRSVWSIQMCKSEVKFSRTEGAHNKLYAIDNSVRRTVCM